MVLKLQYAYSENAWNEYPIYVQHIVEEYAARKICDVGGGANPVLSLQYINENKLDCTVLDISSAELDKTAKGYKKLVRDIEAECFLPTDQFDLVISKMIAEHIRSGRLFHKNIFSMLKPGGIAIHYFPTLYAFPFLINKLIPENLSSFLLDIFLPRDHYQRGKFPAYYNWCYGPTHSMIGMLADIGYEILLYRGYFGHTYFSRIPICAMSIGSIPGIW